VEPSWLDSSIVEAQHAFAGGLRVIHSRVRSRIGPNSDRRPEYMATARTPGSTPRTSASLSPPLYGVVVADPQASVQLQRNSDCGSQGGSCSTCNEQKLQRWADPQEMAADRAADAVMAMRPVAVQRNQPVAVQRSAASGAAATATARVTMPTG